MIVLRLKEAHEFKVGEILHLKVKSISENAPGRWRLEAEAVFPKEPAMLTTGQAALSLGIHVNTVRRWAEKGKLRSYRFGNRGDRRFLKKDLEMFLRRHTVPC
jgi:excisionase family DNA binding protein